jgi:hypothetical protein
VWRRYLIDWPARILDTAWLLYLVLIAALTLACFTAVGLTVLAYLLGFPLP